MVSITPIKGVTVIIFEVNLGKNSFANTAKEKVHSQLEDLENDALFIINHV